MKKSGIREVNSVEDFSNVYKVFGEKPYEEKYTEEDFREIYEEYKELGTIYGAYVDDRCVGLIAILRGKRNGQPVEFESEEGLSYLADIAVLREYRAAGLGTKLLIDALFRAKEDRSNLQSAYTYFWYQLRAYLEKLHLAAGYSNFADYFVDEYFIKQTKN